MPYDFRDNNPGITTDFSINPNTLINLAIIFIMFLCTLTMCSGYETNKVTVTEANRQVAIYEDDDISDEKASKVDCFVNSNLNPIIGSWNDAIFSCKIDSKRVVAYRCQSDFFSPVICSPYVGN